MGDFTSRLEKGKAKGEESPFHFPQSVGEVGLPRCGRKMQGSCGVGLGAAESGPGTSLGWCQAWGSGPHGT